MVNAKVTAFINAVVSKISTLISTHNTSSSAHNDIRNLVSAKADITQSITNGDTTHSPSGDAVYDALSGKSDTGHTHSDYVTTSDSRLTNARTPTSHTHGNISNDGKIGSTSGLPVITTTNGVVTTGSFGSSAGTFCQGNDSRLSDARTPTSHTHNYTDLNNISLVELLVEYTDGTTETIKVLKYTGT